MKIDRERLSRYLVEITKNSDELKTLIRQNHLSPGSLEMKALKYILIELAEGMTITLQHLLAKEKGVAVHGYIDTIAKGFEAGILSKGTFNRLKPFFDFRNSLVHRYWKIDDTLLIQNILNGQDDFGRFVEEIEQYVKSL